MTTGNLYFQDSLGNTSHVTDAAGNLLERYTYDAFGTPTFYNSTSDHTQSAPGLHIKHLFQGQLWTQETGLNDYRNRVELPVIGVFLQPDPIGFKGDAANVYRFCNNNAVNRSDPLGLLIESSEKPRNYDGGVEVRTEEVRAVVTGSWIPQVVGTLLTITAGRSSEGNSAAAAAKEGGVDAADRLGARILREINPQSIESNREKIFVVYQDPNTHRPAATKPITTTETGFLVRIAIPGKEPLKIAHTHGAYSQQDEKTGAISRSNRAGDNFHSDTFSKEIDIPKLREFHATYPSMNAGLLGTPSGKILKYDIATGRITEL